VLRTKNETLEYLSRIAVVHLLAVPRGASFAGDSETGSERPKPVLVGSDLLRLGTNLEANEPAHEAIGEYGREYMLRTMNE
jgi:hypothetical protein